MPDNNGGSGSEKSTSSLYSAPNLGIVLMLLLMLTGALILFVPQENPSCGKQYYARVLSISATQQQSGNLASQTLSVCGGADSGSVAPCPQVIQKSQDQQVVLTPVICQSPSATVGVASEHACSMYLMDGPPVVLTLPAGTYTPQELVGQLNCLLSAQVNDVRYGPAMNESDGAPTTPFPSVTCSPDGSPHTLPSSPTPTSCSCAGPGKTCGSDSPLANAGATCQTPYLTNNSTTTMYRLGGLRSHTCFTQLGFPEPRSAPAPPIPGSILSHIGTTADEAKTTPCRDDTKCTSAPACSLTPASTTRSEFGQLILRMDAATHFTKDNVGCGDAVYKSNGDNVGRVVAVTDTQLTLQEVPLTLTRLPSGTALFVAQTALYLPPKNATGSSPTKTFMNHYMRNRSRSASEYRYLLHLLWSKNLTTDKLEVTKGVNDTLAIQSPDSVTLTVPAGSYAPDDLQKTLNTLLQQQQVPLKMIWKPPKQMLTTYMHNTPPEWYRTAVPQFIYYPQNNATVKSVTVEAGTTCLHVLGLAGPRVPSTSFTVSEQSPAHPAPFLMHNEGEPAVVMPESLITVPRTPPPGTTPSPSAVFQKIHDGGGPAVPSTLPGSVISMCPQDDSSTRMTRIIVGCACIGVGLVGICLILKKK